MKCEIIQKKIKKNIKRTKVLFLLIEFYLNV